jgi:hypothetical protein
MYTRSQVDAIHTAIKSFGRKGAEDFAGNLEYWKEAILDGFEQKAIAVDERLGKEGAGISGIYVVFRLEGDDTLLKLTGSYSSYEGEDWTFGTLYPVVPRQVMMTVYDAVPTAS